MKRLSFQKIFCFISILFIVSCCVFYGTRFIKLYLKNEKVTIKEKDSLVKKIHDNNKNSDLFKEINDDYYFVGKANNNYLVYSNMVFRIIKINQDNEIVAISDKALTSLAFGKNVSYKDSYINKWLNSVDGDNYSGILERQLNDKDNVLVKTVTCHDQVDEINNKECANATEDSYLSLLSTADFAIVGKDSYLVNGEYYYLGNTNTSNKVWQVSHDGKISTDTGLDIIGVRPVITIKGNLKYYDGNGTVDNPYLTEDNRGLFGSYVKLDDTMWRVYQVNDDDIRLVMDSYLMVDGKELTYKYSNISSYHNDTKNGSIAYYLNNTFLKTLSYKDKLKAVKWTNGFYGSTANYDYTKSIDKTVDSKVALLSVSDIRLNNSLNEYYTMTGTSLNSSMVYIVNSNQKLTTKYITNNLKVVPVISLSKELLTEGNGTIESPYEME